MPFTIRASISTSRSVVAAWIATMYLLWSSSRAWTRSGTVLSPSFIAGPWHTSECQSASARSACQRSRTRPSAASAIDNASVISTDATSGLVQPEKSKDGQRQACKKGHFFTAVVDCDHVLFAYSEKHTQEFVKKLFGGFTGYLQSDASNVYDILDRGPPSEDDESLTLVGCWAHCRRYFFEAAICKHSIGVHGLVRIRAIYAADYAFLKLPPAKRKLMRDEHVRPLIDSFFEWVPGHAQRNSRSQPRD
jgi:hypothetical protein